VIGSTIGCADLYLFVCEKSGRKREEERFRLAAGWRLRTNMKRITTSLLCLSALAVTAFAQDNSPAADNSGRNTRDRSSETQTSGDQSNSKPDIQITAAIRRAVTHEGSLSMMAKNVKIITENGTVTLRGPVKTDAEKTKIGELAMANSGQAKIDNQLEVKK
jgi:osmotically-inducible protein OsmY